MYIFQQTLLKHFWENQVRNKSRNCFKSGVVKIAGFFSTALKNFTKNIDIVWQPLTLTQTYQKIKVCAIQK